MIALLGGLGAAVCWAVSALCASTASRAIGSGSTLAWVMGLGLAMVVLPTALFAPASQLTPRVVGLIVGLGRHQRRRPAPRVRGVPARQGRGDQRHRLDRGSDCRRHRGGVRRASRRRHRRRPAGGRRRRRARRGTTGPRRRRTRAPPGPRCSRSPSPCSSGSASTPRGRSAARRRCSGCSCRLACSAPCSCSRPLPRATRCD